MNNKPFLFLLLSACLISATTLARPIRGNSAASEVSYSLDPEPLNTDYIQVSPTSGENARQLMGVEVGYGTPFTAGARLVMDVTVIEWNTEFPTMFAYCSGSGYMWMRLIGEESIPAGRHTITWINQPNTTAYNVLIDGFPSVAGYSTWWQLRNMSYPLYIGNYSGSWGHVFRGCYHRILLYDALGNLRHSWIPDPSGVFYDQIGDTFTTVDFGSFIYGDLANE